MIRLVPGLRLRPVPELSTCLAFTPHPPRLHTLNPSAWLILELCRDGVPSGGEGLEAGFLRRTAPLSREDALEQLRTGLAALVAAGLLDDTETEREAA